MAHGFIFSLQKINKQTALKDARKINYFKAVNYHPDTLKCVFLLIKSSYYQKEKILHSIAFNALLSSINTGLAHC